MLTVTTSPWSNVYGVARTIIALATGLTLVSNRSSVLFPYGVSCDTFSASLFCMVPFAYIEAARWFAVFLLVLVASGWLPRITGVLHWWVAASFFVHSEGIDGGDHLTGVITLILIPLTLTDPRRWHWETCPAMRCSNSWHMRVMVGWSAVVVARVQMAGVYFHAFVAKMEVDEWKDGTALYYWFTDNDFGLPRALMCVLEPLLLNGVFVVGLTWGSILVEVLLFLGIVASVRVRALLLCLGLCFHGLIAVGIGLWSFSTTMAGALILYLRPPEQVFALERLRDIVVKGGLLKWEQAK